MSALEECGPCCRDNAKNRSSVWCVECEEALCGTCQKAHSLLKTTNNHHLIETENLTPELIPLLKLSAIHSCDAHGNDFDSYCNNHGVVCCPACIKEDHQSCTDIEALDKAARDIKSSKALERTNERARSVIQILGDIREEKENNIKDMNQSAIDIKQTIEQLKNDIIERVNQIAEEILSELSSLKDSNISKLKKQTDAIEEQIKSIESKSNHLEFITNNSTETHTFLFMDRLKADLASDEKWIKKAIEESSFKYLHFKKSNEVITSFGEIKLVVEPTELKYTPTPKVKSNTEETAVNTGSAIKTLKLCSEFELNVENGFVSGMCINEDDLLLLCIRGGDKLLLYSFEGKPKGEIKVEGNPYDVSCIVETDKAVVALPNTSCLQIVDVDLKNAEDVIEVPESCWSVTAIQNKLIVAGGYNKLYVLDMEGKRLEEITKPENGRTYSLTFRDDKFFYCADVDFKNEKVYCITEEGKLVFCYTNSNLKTPTEVTVDRSGNMYIADLDSNNVQRCTPSGHFLDVLLKGSDLTEPRAISFNKHSTHFAVANNNGRSICIYQLIQ